MNKNLIFRILGALSSALIIISVFVPFISSYSLWETYNLTNSLYLPILIIIFGVIGSLFFSLGVKTEFAYMSTGATMFFLVCQTIEIIDFKMFNIGYYFLLIGSLLTGIMAFLTNLKIKTNEIRNIEAPLTDSSIQNKTDEISSFQTENFNQVIEPIVSSVQVPEISVQNKINLKDSSSLTSIPIKEVSERLSSPTPVQSIDVNQNISQPIVNPVEQFNGQVTSMPFPQFNIDKPVSSFNSQIQNSIPEIPVVEPNPVVKEFISPNNQESNENQNLHTNPVETDIFGQPINR